MNDVGAKLADITEEAARLILPLWRSGLEVSTKADKSPVTEADQRGEALILERLAEAFPGVPVVSEEDASEFGTPDQIGPRFFLVDPLDGTKAFVRGDPNFTVNIGLIDNGRPVAGAVTAPPTGETWFTQGGRALKRVNGGEAEPVRARAWPDGAAVALISHTMKEDHLRELIQRYGFDHPKPMDSSIKLCRIAEGAADIYPRHGPTMEWDIAAGHAVLEAAGGRLTTLEGAPFNYGKAQDGFRNGFFVARGA
ncbi:3'(2'),5'-bisphosphate nucleotidase CysQ [Phenylobacterium sp.]|uniref:3'(2'),5'-bisphosphate nucleotidase CysQ n=1 Tax=Phenylobacterium sp. TaxID=1871053 RepID=UPI0035AED48B